MRLRMSCKSKNEAKLKFLVNKYDVRHDQFEGLCEEDKETYREARVFKDEGVKPDEMRNPVVVCRRGESIQLSDDELSVLRLGPKFCVYANLDEEEFAI